MPKWTNHRELEKVRVHKKVTKYLGEIDYCYVLNDTLIYNKHVVLQDANISTGNNEGTGHVTNDINTVHLSGQSPILLCLSKYYVGSEPVSDPADSIDIEKKDE